MSNPSSESTTYNDIIYYVFIMHLKAEQPPPPTHTYTHCRLSGFVPIKCLKLILHNCNNWSPGSADILTNHLKCPVSSRHVFSQVPITHADLFVFIQY